MWKAATGWRIKTPAKERVQAERTHMEGMCSSAGTIAGNTDLMPATLRLRYKMRTRNKPPVFPNATEKLTSRFLSQKLWEQGFLRQQLAKSYQNLECAKVYHNNSIFTNSPKRNTQIGSVKIHSQEPYICHNLGDTQLLKSTY